MQQEFSLFLLFTWICRSDLSKLILIASYDGCHARSRWRLLNPEHLVVLLAGPISHTSTQYIDFVEILNISLDLPTIYFVHFVGILLILVSVELPLCVVVTLS